MNGIPLSFTIREYERTLSLVRGEVRVEGVSPTFVPFEIDNFRRMLAFDEYDVSEMSMSSYLIAREKGTQVVAIPVFPHRRFRHSYIFVSSGGQIREPRDLVGKKVGIPEYQITALVWIRGFLQHDFDVRPEQIKWFSDREDRLAVSFPEKVAIEKIPAKSKERLFLEGKLDSIIDGKVPGIFLDGNEKIRRLFENYKEVETDYYRRTGIFPIMHTVVVRKKVLEENPWVAVSVWKAFAEAKIRSYERMRDPRLSNLVWPLKYADEEGAILGEDPWRYNVRDNMKALEALVQYEQEQGLITKAQKVEDLFATNTYDLTEEKLVPYDL
ncbi:MAG TPA: PhnD/SsuA/transferrin family substrate-binding protein [Nitrososphaerales archaeon]|nr:PhnD/SsuA/transferrin family substrate-binding protein [Nitrososphaerales archaeon]